MRYIYIFFLISPSLWALSIGNPSSPSIIYEGIFLSDKIPVSLRLGGEADFLLEKKFTFPNTALKNAQLEGDFYLATAVINFLDRLDLGASAGTSEFDFTTSFQSLDMKEKSDTGYIVKLHGKLIIFKVKCATLGFDGKYALAKASIDEFLNFPSKTWLRFQQWQVSFALSTELGFFSPYAGGVYNSSHFKISPFGFQRIRGKEKEKLGLFMGLTFSNHSYFFLTFEGQVWSEVSFNLNGQIRF